MALPIPIQPLPVHVPLTPEELYDAAINRVNNLGGSAGNFVGGTFLVFASLEAVFKTNDLSCVFFAALGAFQGMRGAYKFAKNWPTRVTRELIREEQCTAWVEIFSLFVSATLVIKILDKAEV